MSNKVIVQGCMECPFRMFVRAWVGWRCDFLDEKTPDIGVLDRCPLKTTPIEVHLERNMQHG